MRRSGPASTLRFSYRRNHGSPLELSSHSRWVMPIAMPLYAESRPGSRYSNPVEPNAPYPGGLRVGAHHPGEFLRQSLRRWLVKRQSRHALPGTTDSSGRRKQIPIRLRPVNLPERRTGIMLPGIMEISLGARQRECPQFGEGEANLGNRWKSGRSTVKGKPGGLPHQNLHATTNYIFPPPGHDGRSVGRD